MDIETRNNIFENAKTLAFLFSLVHKNSNEICLDKKFVYDVTKTYLNIDNENLINEVCDYILVLLEEKYNILISEDIDF